MNLTRLVKVLVVVVGVALLVFSWLAYYDLRKENQALQNLTSAQKLQSKSVDFLKMFVKRVLKAQGEVDFETRLKLENAVRELNDEAVLAKWQAFVGSANEAEAQKNVKDLLELLVDKIK